MNTSSEKTSNNLYIYEKDGILIKKVSYANNLQEEINRHSNGLLADVISKNDFSLFLKTASKFGYKIYRVIEM